MNNSVNRYKAGQKKKNIFNNTKFEDVEKRLSWSSLEDDDDDSLVLQYEVMPFMLNWIKYYAIFWSIFY